MNAWKSAFKDSFKLMEARKEYKRRYQRGETKLGDKHKEIARERYRIKHGIDPNLPALTSSESAANARKVKTDKTKQQKTN
jgi:hypothetical protein